MRSICKIPKWCYFILFFSPGMNVTLRNKDSHQEGRNQDSHWGFSCRSSSGLFLWQRPWCEWPRSSFWGVSSGDTGLTFVHSTFITHTGRLLIPLWTSKRASPIATGGQTGSRGCLQLDQPAVQMCCPGRCCSRRVWAWSRFMDSN